MPNDIERMRICVQQFLGVWDIYIKFYTAFLTVNLAALGVVVEKMQKHRARRVVCWAFMTQNALSLGTAVGLAMYSYAVVGLIARMPDSHELAACRPLGVWGGVANAMSHVLFIGLWIAVLRGVGSDGTGTTPESAPAPPTPSPPAATEPHVG